MAYEFIEEYKNMYANEYNMLTQNMDVPIVVNFLRNMYFKCSNYYDLRRHSPMPFSLAIEWVPAEIDNALYLFDNYNGSFNDFVNDYEIELAPTWL